MSSYITASTRVSRRQYGVIPSDVERSMSGMKLLAAGPTQMDVLVLG